METSFISPHLKVSFHSSIHPSTHPPIHPDSAPSLLACSTFLHKNAHPVNPSTTVHASVPSNTFAIYGNGEDKELTELVPGILNQLGPDSLASLRRLAESYQSMQKKEGGGTDGGASSSKKGGQGPAAAADDDDDEIPDLVEGENFESKVE
jgi:hypothetical protein